MDRADFAAQEVRAQLKGRNENYNRNLFQVKTDDKVASAIRNYCDKNGLVTNQFLNKLITDFFND
tara:strand:+ start:1178 stop:1372 length:195 start_codon:yes stop_codon:yes gene_type:complete